jgi:hypothetical protein
MYLWLLTSRSPDWFAGRRAGLEFVEKLLQRSSPARTQRSETPACCWSFTGVPLRRLVVVGWLLALALRRPGRRSA